jgi:predicted transcriptional regulator
VVAPDGHAGRPTDTPRERVPGRDTAALCDASGNIDPQHRPRRACPASVEAVYVPAMKATISIPDPIFRQAEKLARRLRKSRSRLHADAVSAYVRRHGADAGSESLNRVCAEAGDRIRPFVDAAGRRLLSKVEW